MQGRSKGRPFFYVEDLANEPHDTYHRGVRRFRYGYTGNRKMSLNGPDFAIMGVMPPALDFPSSLTANWDEQFEPQV